MAASGAHPGVRTPSNMGRTACARGPGRTAARAQQHAQPLGRRHLARRWGWPGPLPRGGGGAGGAAPGHHPLRAASSGGSAASSSSSSSGPPAGRLLLDVLDKQVLPLSLVLAIWAGFVWPATGVQASQAALTGVSVQQAITMFIFVLAGLQLKRGDAVQALTARGCVAFGIASILLFTPLLAPLMLALPLPFTIRPVALGVAIFACMPTSLSSGISMTGQCGGNIALAILLTIATNVLSVLTLPLLLPALVGGAVGPTASLQPGLLLVQLTKVVLIPTMFGAAARAFVPGVAAVIDANRKAIVYLSAGCLATVPWMQVSRAVSQGLALTAADVLLAAALGVGVHGAFLAFNTGAAGVLRLGGADALQALRLRTALVLQASQKTLPVAVALIAGLAPPTSSAMAAAASASAGASILAAPGAVGLACVAAVVAHLMQITMDSLLLPLWAKEIQAAEQAQLLMGKLQ